MDNAQKAIMIGVGLFITIIIISSVLLISNMGTNLITSAQSQLSGITKVNDYFSKGHKKRKNLT